MTRVYTDTDVYLRNSETKALNSFAFKNTWHNWWCV